MNFIIVVILFCTLLQMELERPIYFQEKSVFYVVVYSNM